MELRLPKGINRFYRLVFLIIFMFVGYYNLFLYCEIPLYGLNELENFGTILFVLVISACESALVTIFLWWVIKNVKKTS